MMCGTKRDQIFRSIVFMIFVIMMNCNNQILATNYAFLFMILPTNSTI